MSNPAAGLVDNSKPTSTAHLLMLLEHETNPVTRASYRQIIGNRIDSLTEQLNKRSHP